MKYSLAQVRDLEIIEKELKDNNAGVFSFVTEEDELKQVAKPFVYLDKNIYIFFSNSDEMYDKIVSDNAVKFTVVKNYNPEEKDGFIPKYHFMRMSVNGVIKKLEDLKHIDEMQGHYLQKYCNEIPSADEDLTHISKLVMIDTEELQAIEEKGG